MCAKKHDGFVLDLNNQGFLMRLANMGIFLSHIAKESGMETCSLKLQMRKELYKNFCRQYTWLLYDYAHAIPEVNEGCSENDLMKTGYLLIGSRRVPVELDETIPVEKIIHSKYPWMYQRYTQIHVIYRYFPCNMMGIIKNINLGADVATVEELIENHKALITKRIQREIDEAKEADKLCQLSQVEI